MRPWHRLVHRSPARALATALSLIFVAAALAVLPAGTAAAAGPQVTLGASADSTVLVGTPITYTLTARNPDQAGAVPEYNLAFRTVLPAGVTYKSGSARPTAAGEPTIRTNGTPARQTLVWSNVSDLPVGAEKSLTFQVTPDPATYPVGATVSTTAEVYAQSDPRTLPAFSGTGTPVGGSYSQTATSAATTTTITAVAITKSEPSPEHELLRGIHDQTTVYTLAVTNNGNKATNGVTVIDYLPAQLEFLGCGTVDRTTAGVVEYAGAPRLDVSTPDLTANCPAPSTVDTVSLAAGNPQGLAAGVYTKVTWSLGNLAAEATRLVTYRAGIPQRANVLFGAGAPTPGSLGQAANLDNNTGASTRETDTEQSLTNRAEVSGVYTGTVAGGTSTTVSDATTLTVTSEDLAMQKSVTPTTFAPGGVATYTLSIETGEYADASDIVVTDTLPDGLCPLDTSANHAPGAPPECDPGAAFAPTGATIVSADHNPDGTYTIVFSPVAALAHDGTHTITFQARMRSDYHGETTDPTVSGDSYTNRVSLVGTTTMRSDVAAPAPAGVLTAVADTSSATQTSDAPVLVKTIKPTTTAYDCTPDGSYAKPGSPADAAVTFAEGSRVCFKLRIDFSRVNSTKNPVLTDFLPAYLTYEPGSAHAVGANNVAAALDTSGPLTWTLGTPQGSDRFVAAGGVFEYVLSGTVTAPPVGPAPDITANLAKLTWTNTTGEVGFTRDSVDFSVAAAPPVAVLKSARRLTPTPVVTVVDGGQVASGDLLEYTVAVTDNGTAANRNDIDVIGPDVWDVLPAGLSCAAVSSVSDGGVCTDPLQPDHPTFASNGTLSAIRWDLADTVRIAPAATRSLTYRMLIPTDPRIATAYLNTGAVASYATDSNLGTRVQHHPASNIDTTVTAGMVDTIAASDTHTVNIRHVSVTKANTTAITPTSSPGDPNNPASSGVIGEDITYTVQATVPAHTTVYNGKLTDPMPTGISLLSAQASFSADGATFGALPTGVVLDPRPGSGAAGYATVTFGSAYVNDTDTDQVFKVVIAARVDTLAANVHNLNRVNTATFASTSTISPVSSALSNRTATSTIRVIEPSVTLEKTDDTTNHQAVVGQTITYTLTARNASGRPALHDAYVVDCVPDGVTVTGVGTVPAGDSADVAPGDGSNGCQAGKTRLLWQIDDLAGGAASALTYTAEIDPSSAGLRSYLNTAVLTGSDLADGTNATSAIERSYGAGANDTVTVTGALFAKSTSTPTRTIGQRARFTTTVTLPADVNFYDSAVNDTLPAGLDPASVELEQTTCTPECTVSPVELIRNGQGVGWSLGDFAYTSRQRTITLTYTALVADVPTNKAGHALTNSARFGWDLTDGEDKSSTTESSERETPTAAATVTVQEPDLTISKTVDEDAPVPGEQFGYSLAVRNSTAANTSAAYDVVVVDTIPTGVVVDADSISDGGVLTGQTRAGGGRITWTFDGPLAASNTLTVTYAARLASPTPTGALVNTADITGYHSIAGGGRAYDGPQATATVRPGLPHVAVAKSVVGGPLAYIDEAKTWQITVTNDGDGVAYAVDAVDTLPIGWTYVAESARVSVAGGAPVAVEPVVAGRELTWTDLGDLVVRGQTVVVTFQATPGASVVTTPGVGHGVDHTNTVSVTAEDANGNTGAAGGEPFNGPAATAVAHVDSADLAITKTPVGAAVAGEDVSWRITVGNGGPDPVVGPVTVSDTMPGVLASVTATGNGWTCSGTAPVSCSRSDSLAAGQSYPVITVTGRVPAGLASGTDLTNAATVRARTHDPATKNNDTTSRVTSTTVADLGIDKALSGELVAGETATYTLDVTNHGPSVHRGPVEITDVVPAGTTFVSATGTGWDCSELDGSITCTRSDDLAVGSVPQVVVRVAVDPARLAEVVNTATVVGDGPGGTPDPEPDNDTDTVRTTPDTLADLTIDKAHRGRFVAGEEGTYRFTVHNGGPSDARAVRVTDALPEAVDYVRYAAVSGSWTCTADGRDLTCSLAAPLAAGSDAVVDVVVAVDAAHTGGVDNTATLTSTTPLTGTSVLTDTDRTDATVEADLEIVKLHDAGTPVVAGGRVTYSVTVTNRGPSVSVGPIEVTDTLPAGMTCVTIDDVDCSAGPATHTRKKALAVGASYTLTVVAAVDPSAGPATLVNRASVSGPDDPDPTNDGASDPTVVVDRADVSITKTVTGDDPVRAGEQTSFALDVHNDGPSDADGVSVTDTLPDEMTLVSISGSGWTCDRDTITCTRATLAAGASSRIDVVVRVDSATPDGTELANAADVTTTTAGNDTSDDHASVTVGVIARADLVLTKRHVGDVSVTAGTSTTYTLDVRNAGPSDAVGPLVVVDTLPAGQGYLSAQGGWDCAAVHQEVTCSLAGDLAAGASAATLTIRVQVAAGADTGEATNHAEVSSQTTDPTPANDHDEATVFVGRLADLSVLKSHTGASTIGSQVDFALVVRNDGPSTARSVVLTDALPAGLRFDSVDGGTAWTCSYDAAAATVACAYDGSLAPDATADPVHVLATVLPGAYPGVTNTATVTTETPEVDRDDNASSDELEVPALADLAVVKEHVGELVVGETGSYELTVTNQGPTEVPGTVTVTDALPAGLSYVEASGDGWTCAGLVETITCTRAGMVASSTSVIGVVVNVGPGAYPSLTNTATVGSETAETDQENNSSTDVAPVTPTMDLTLEKAVDSQVGRSVTWRLQVTSHGPSATVDPVVVTDRLPAELTYLRASGPGWDCDQAGQVVTCTHEGSLAVEESATVRLVTELTVSSGETVRNTAAVTGGWVAAPVTDTSSATVKAPTSTSASFGTATTALPDTGGPRLWLLPLGALLAMAGLALVLRSRRRA